MSTRSQPQFSFFDLAKNYIESFIKARSRNDRMIGREGDRYFLATTEDRYPKNIKIISEKSASIVADEIRKLQLPYGTGQLHLTLLDSFRLLHVNRAQTGIDGVGSGRVTQNTDQVVMVLLTDGSGISSIPIDFRLQFDPPFLGSEMTKEAFRWDQKLYAVVFRIPSTPYRPSNSQLNNIDIDVPIIEKICARTGGRSFSILSTRQIQVSIDHILGMNNGHKLGVRFDVLPAIHFTAGPVNQAEIDRIRGRFKKVTEKKPVTNLISRLNPQGRPVTCHWPIPESYFPMRAMDQLPQRTANPVILVAPLALPLTIRPEVPVDKMELEPGSGVAEIVMEILQGKRDMTVWTYIEGASNGPTAPFGCFRMNASGLGVTLLLLPYNFPLLYPLIEEVVKEPLLNGSQVWRQRLDSYFQTVPYYYFTQLRILLDRIKVKVEYNSSMSNIYAGQLLSHLNKLKVKAKEEFDSVGIATKLNESRAPNLVNPSIRIERITSRTSIIGLGKEDDDVEEENLDGVEPAPIYSGDFKIPLYPPTVLDAPLDTAYRTPYTSSIEDLVSKLNRIQANVDLLFDPNKTTILDLAKVGVKPRFNTIEERHNMPQKLMGEYEPYQRSREKHYGSPMRKIDEEKDRTHAFGNPYKLKGMGAGIDEVMDSAVVDNPSSPNQGKRYDPTSRQFVGGGPPKRRRGPLGIDAFDQYRTRRSMRGSTIDPSELSSDFGGTPSPGGQDDYQLMGDSPGTSGSSTPISEFGDLQLVEMDSDDVFKKNLEEIQEIMKRRKEKGDQKDQEEGFQILEPPAPPGEILSTQEILTRKIRIGSIVRKPANQRAFEEIMTLVAGITQDACAILIRYAVRESQRFKLKQLTQKLEERLNAI